MPLIHDKLYQRIAIFGLLALLIASWFSIGYNQCDEHFQVLEFCNYKLGASSSSALPWEFTQQCRSALQPLGAYILCKILLWIGYYNPFTVSFLMRLIMGICTWLLTCRIVILLLPKFKTGEGKQVYVWCSFLLWFVPYMGVHFSAENIGGLLFITAISYLPGLLATDKRNHNLRLIICGLMLGFALMIRVQMAFAFLVLVVWLIGYVKWGFKNWAIVVLAGCVAIALAVVADHWLYGEWVFTPLNYFRVNIVEHVADHYGTSPWWYYPKLFFDYAVPPLSYILLPLFVFGVWKNPRSLFSWLCIVFIVGHSLIAHKEIRFLMPIILPFIFLTCKGYEELLLLYPRKKIYKVALTILAGLNILLLFIKILIPAHESFAYYKFIYDFAQKQPVTLIGYQQSPYSLVDLEVNFYKPKDLQVDVVNSPSQLNDLLNRNNGRAVLFLNPKVDPLPLIANNKKTRLYCLMPDWLSLFNFNNWMSRAHISVLYQLK